MQKMADYSAQVDSGDGDVPFTLFYKRADIGFKKRYKNSCIF